MMKNCIAGLLKVILLLGALTTPVQAQKLTEKYIPIGRSPGLSGKFTVIGKVDKLDFEEQCITVLDANRKSYIIVCTEKTHFWLDRSAVEKPNQDGALRQCQRGRRVEIKFRDNDLAKPAEWVKVEVTAPE
jgi:hypothetical protein